MLPTNLDKINREGLMLATSEVLYENTPICNHTESYRDLLQKVMHAAEYFTEMHDFNPGMEVIAAFESDPKGFAVRARQGEVLRDHHGRTSHR